MSTNERSRRKAREDSPIEVELKRRAVEQQRARTGRPQALPPLIREYAYVLLTVSFLGYWLWTGAACLVLWFLPHGDKNSVGIPILFGGWFFCWVLLFPATLLWHAPELLKRELGPRPHTAKGFVGYLLRNSDKGVFDGSIPLVLDTSAPPGHFWLVGVLFTFFSCYGAVTSFGVPTGDYWTIPFTAAFAACIASLAILTHGVFTRRAARRRAAQQKAGTTR
ncbi:hypothetical protein [Streptomyces sp. Ag109_O5-1]|uniref:hypothetical protein n=1 Tax=Streptomyces sp. Ag109_O5-1 TaxID=1938851 RepID=UPI000F4F31E2|nr:hypothetical protein [Streptomyces sp. Ag109_O5-1]